MNLDAVLTGDPGQLVGQPTGVHEPAGVTFEGSGQEDRAVDLGSHGGPVEKLPGALASPLDLVRFDGHLEHAGALELAVDTEVGDVGRHALEVRGPEPLELVVLPRPAAAPVGLAVGSFTVMETRVAEGLTMAMWLAP